MKYFIVKGALTDIYDPASAEKAMNEGFCGTVSQMLGAGWELHGAPFVHGNSSNIVCQALVKSDET